MGKISRQITLDPDVDAIARTSGANVSDLCNNFLRSYFMREGYENPDIVKRRIQTELVQHKKNIAVLQAELSRINSEQEFKKKDQEKQDLKKKEENFDALRRSGFLEKASEAIK